MESKGQTGQSRFAQASSANGAIATRPTTGQIRNAQRAELSRFNDPRVALPNPTARAPFDRTQPQPYESKVRALGLAPNAPKHFWQLLKGDSGAGSSVFRRVTLFQQLAVSGARVASTPYSKAIQVATMRSTDQRPRYFQVSLFSTGRVIETDVPIGPLPDDEILRFSPGIPQDFVPIAGFDVARGVPLISTTKFRIMVHDESGQRFFDVDVVGTKSLNLYAWGVTVFALIKEEGYEVDRQGAGQEQFNGMLDQAIAGARIIPIRSNFTQNVNHRTVSVFIPPEIGVSIIPIPPGSKTVQAFCADGAVRYLEFSVLFGDIDPVNSGVSGAIGTLGSIDPEPGRGTSSIYRIPDSNAIFIVRIAPNPAIFTFVFEETP